MLDTVYDTVYSGFMSETIVGYFMAGSIPPGFASTSFMIPPGYLGTYFSLTTGAPVTLTTTTNPWGGFTEWSLFFPANGVAEEPPLADEGGDAVGPEAVSIHVNTPGCS